MHQAKNNNMSSNNEDKYITGGNNSTDKQHSASATLVNIIQCVEQVLLTYVDSAAVHT